MTTTKTRQVLWMASKPGHVGSAPEGWTVHTAGWNELPTDIDPGEIERVVLLDHIGSKMPTVLAKLPNVRSLGTDTHLLSFTTDELPNLEELNVVGTSEVELPRGPWPKLRSVEARDAKVSIAAAGDFPVLATLAIGTKGTKKVLTEIAKLQQLRELRFGPVKDDATLGYFDGLPLEVLAFNRGGIASLKGVVRFTKLTGFGAMNCHGFGDLAPLAELPLKEVWFNTCAGIKKPDALLSMKKLERVMFWGCRDNRGALKKVAKRLMANGVSVDTELFE
jgi:hypothetical protein